MPSSTLAPPFADLSSVDARVMGESAELLDTVLGLVDRGEVQATSPERAYLSGASASLRLAAAVVRG